MLKKILMILGISGLILTATLITHKKSDSVLADKKVFIRDRTGEEWDITQLEIMVK